MFMFITKLMFPPSLPLELDLVVGLERSVLAPSDHRYPITSHHPFLPLLVQLIPTSLHLVFLELSNSHVWVKGSISFQLRDCCCDDLVDLLKLVVFGLWHQEHSAMGEEVHLPEDNIKRRYFF